LNGSEQLKRAVQIRERQKTDQNPPRQSWKKLNKINDSLLVNGGEGTFPAVHRLAYMELCLRRDEHFGLTCRTHKQLFLLVSQIDRKVRQLHPTFILTLGRDFQKRFFMELRLHA